jgi:hypothetical protein
MENVLRLYSATLRKTHPLVCLDERPVQLHADVHQVKYAKPGRATLRDAEYKRHGTANVFAIVAPQLGIHLTHATSNRKSNSYVRALQRIVMAFPNATKIQLVQDNLSTHTEAACIRTLGEVEGKKLWNKFDIHYTPKHGSWLNIAETEISMWSRECLGKRRIPTLRELKTETRAWNKSANKKQRTITWDFDVSKARRKFSL